MIQDYERFLKAKVVCAQERGREISPGDVHPMLFSHQRDIVQWAVRGGRRAIFASFGLGKTFMQLEILRLLERECGGRYLIVAPLGVRQEFSRDAATLGADIRFVRSIDDCGPTGLYMTNYETVRDGKLDPSHFTGASLDEAACLRGFGGTKTFREFMRLFESVQFRFVATATPSPNEFIELLAYSAFLGVMDVGEAKTRFFKRDSTKADALTLHPHKAKEFWLWVSTWAIFIQRPSDLGYDDTGYILPEMEVRWHEVPSDHSQAGEEVGGQGRLLKNAALGVTHAAREKRNSLSARLAKLMELRASDRTAHRLIWHDLEVERAAIKESIPSCATVYGSQDRDEQERIIIDFSDGELQELAGKPVMLGSGPNFQRHCAWAIFLGIGFKFKDFIQAIHRVQRFGQTEKVRLDLIYTEAEREIRADLQRKWDQHNELVAQMTAIIREYGMASHVAAELQRSMGVERAEVKGDRFRLVNNDSVLECSEMSENSVHLILTSIPFSTQYEYTPSYNDFGHTDNNAHFWQQMDFLTPQLLRVLKPGRVAAIHVKDRIVPGGLTGLGFQTAYRFSDDCAAHFEKHGFAFLARKTIVTDVVRENNQTYRLGWTEQCKDGSRMGCGMPEYLLLFRKPPTDSSNGYADESVIKDKQNYSRSRWQIDAHGFMRSSGNRLLSPEDLNGVKHERIFKMFREYSLTQIYNFEQHVKLSESLETCPDCGHIHIGSDVCRVTIGATSVAALDTGAEFERCPCRGAGRLPVTFMLFQPQSWHPDAWTDVTRMLSLNSAQSAHGREMHLCPMQFDIADRVIAQFSMEGEVVFDPFVGIGTVAYRAVKLKRFGLGIELNPRYFADGVHYCRQAEQDLATPDLFALEEIT